MGHTDVDLELTNYFSQQSVIVRALVDPLKQQVLVNPLHPDFSVFRA